MLYPSANQPRQVEGVEKCDGDGHKDLVVVEKNVVTKAKKESFNNFIPVHDKYDLPSSIFNPGDMKWVHYEPKGKMLILDEVFPTELILIILVEMLFIYLP